MGKETVMPPATRTVHLRERSYDIHCRHDDLPALAAGIQRHVRSSVALVTDRHVQPHAARLQATLSQAKVAVHLQVLEPGETQKCLSTASQLYDWLAQIPADRQTLVVALGGGVIGDLAGFVAATFNRGLPLLMVPTTLLAMVDSAVGGKTGINHPRGKNLIGAFHQPCAVWIDTAYLETLPDREFRSALAEVVKYGMILAPELLHFLETHTEEILARAPECLQHLILESCRLKAEVVEQDEYETKGLRVILNYGHTFAHAFETVAGYGQLLHGEAVALGMVCASRLAEKCGLIAGEITQRQVRLLTEFGLPVTVSPTWEIAALVRTMYQDKKTQASRLRFVLPTRVGHVKLVADVPEAQVWEVLREAIS
jgi:3-dehydroquinate synthase